jgi:hypothetical protein
MIKIIEILGVNMKNEERIKLNKMFIFIGILFPIMGIILGGSIELKDEIIGRSIKKGSAISTLIIFLVLVFIFLYTIGTS